MMTSSYQTNEYVMREIFGLIKRLGPLDVLLLFSEILYFSEEFFSPLFHFTK
jgi:hypothetical protein